MNEEDPVLEELQHRLLLVQQQLRKQKARTLRRSCKVSPSSCEHYESPNTSAITSARHLAKLYKEDLSNFRSEQQEMVQFMAMINSELDKQVQARRDEALMYRMESRMQQTNLHTIKELITLMSTLGGRSPVESQPEPSRSVRTQKEARQEPASRHVTIDPQVGVHEANRSESDSIVNARERRSSDIQDLDEPRGLDPVREDDVLTGSFPELGAELFDESLLELSDDESVDEETLATKKRIERSTKSLVIAGDLKPMYRWRRLGFDDVQAGQVLKGKALLRSMALVKVFISRTQRFAENKKKAAFAKDQTDMQELLDWFLDKSQVWLLKAVRQPLQSIISSPKLDLDPRPQATSLRKAITKKLKGRQGGQGKAGSDPALKLKVRMRAVLEAVLTAVERNKPPVPTGLVSFLKRIVSDGSAFPNQFLFVEEYMALEFTRSGHTRWMIQEGDATDFSRGILVLSNFVIKRCLIPMILKPWDHGLGHKPSKLAQHNLLVLASLLYTLSRHLHRGPSAGQPNPVGTIDPALIAQAQVQESQGQRESEAHKRNKRAVNKVKVANAIAKGAGDGKGRQRRRSSLSIRRLSSGLASLRRASQFKMLMVEQEIRYDDKTSVEMAAQLLGEDCFDIPDIQDSFVYFKLLIERFVLGLYKTILVADAGNNAGDQHLVALDRQIKELDDKMDEKGTAARSQFDTK